jgi:predicted porin
MKKSLLAVAAMTAFAGAAQAQSSVTVYGIIDMGFTNTNQRATVGNVTAKETTSAFTASNQQSSRLGFKGTEDLGGGVSAFFTVESELDPNGGTAIYKNRQSLVGLNNKKFGSASFGTQYTPIHEAVGATDPGQQNNVVGSVIYPSSPYISASTADSNTLAYTVRTGNMAKFVSSNFAGFQGKAFYTLNNKNETQNGTLGGTQNTNGYGIGLNYNWQKLLVTANYQSFKNEDNGAAASISAASTVSGIFGVNVTNNQTYVAATYDFGILKAYLGYINRKVTSGLDSNQYAKRSAQQVGVRSFITPKVEGWASIGNGRDSAFGANNPTVNFNAWQLGSNYWLSKRTNLYGIYGQELSSSSNVLGKNYNQGASQFAVGVRHTF